MDLIVRPQQEMPAITTTQSTSSVKMQWIRQDHLRDRIPPPPIIKHLRRKGRRTMLMPRKRSLLLPEIPLLRRPQATTITVTHMALLRDRCMPLSWLAFITAVLDACLVT